MELTITFGRETVKTLTPHGQAAFRSGDLPRSKRIAALLMLADPQPPQRGAARLGVGRSTVYAWLNAVRVDRVASWQRRTPAGRPAQRTPTQKQRLEALVEAGPEAAGYATGCWPSALLHALIVREFGVLYHVHDVSELLHNLGFASQQARVVSDHLHDQVRAAWLTQWWPAIVQAARRTGAWLLCGDEARFAPWGSLGSTGAKRGQQPPGKTGGKRKG